MMPDDLKPPPESTREALGPQPFGAAGDLIAKLLLGADPENSSAFYRALRAVAGSPIEAPAFQPTTMIGPARGLMQELLPARLFNRLERDPRVIYNATTLDLLRQANSFAVSGTPAQFNYSRLVSPGHREMSNAMQADPRIGHGILMDMSPPSLPILRDSAIHEALHALLPGQFLSKTAGDELVRRSVVKGLYPPERIPYFSGQSSGEPAIEVLTQNVMRRMMPAESSKLAQWGRIKPLADVYQDFWP